MSIAIRRLTCANQICKEPEVRLCTKSKVKMQHLAMITWFHSAKMSNLAYQYQAEHAFAIFAEQRALRLKGKISGVALITVGGMLQQT